MNYAMKDYYNVLHFLRDFFVDREYPLTFSEDDDISNLNNVELVTEYTSTHDNSYKITNISEGDLITFIIPYRKYDTTDKFELNILSTTSFKPSDIDIIFSESKTAEPYLKVVKNAKVYNEDKEEITDLDADTIYNVKYTLKETATKLDKKSKQMSMLQSISLRFNDSFDMVYLSDMVFRTEVYQRTLEDIDYHFEDAKNHITSRLRLPTIPSELEPLIPKAAAAYSWLMWWENEGRAMGDGTELSRNYYDRLMSEVNFAIDQWLNDNKEALPDDINTKLVGYTRLISHEYITRNPRKHISRFDKKRLL